MLPGKKLLSFALIATLMLAFSSFSPPSLQHKPDKHKTFIVADVQHATTVKAVEEIINLELSQHYQHAVAEATDVISLDVPEDVKILTALSWPPEVLGINQSPKNNGPPPVIRI